MPFINHGTSEQIWKIMLIYHSERYTIVAKCKMNVSALITKRNKNLV